MKLHPISIMRKLKQQLDNAIYQNQREISYKTNNNGMVLIMMPYDTTTVLSQVRISHTCDITVLHPS